MSQIIELVGELHITEEVIHEIGTVVVLGGSGGAGGGVWLSGEGAPVPALGANGDFYLDTSTGDVHRKLAGVWIFQLKIKGRDGEDGDDGDPGPGLPAGGTTGQYARKVSNASYDVEWADFPEIRTAQRQILRVGHQENDAVSGGPAVAGSWFTRKVNHLYRNDIAGAIFDATNYRVWLEPGSYRYRWIMRGYAVDSWMGRLYSPEAGIDLRSMAAFSSSANAAQKDASDFGDFTITTAGWVYVQMKCDSSRLANDGCGYAMWYGGPEIYLKLEIEVLQ